jgi:CRISPR-associated protein Cmr1
VKKFPRGQFGLPIIFHFKDKGEPSDTTLQGAHHDRLGSPLILRPLICKDGAIGLGAKLVSYDPPGGYILKGAPKDPPVEVHFTDADKHQAKLIRPLQNGETDVIEAFLKTLK